MDAREQNAALLGGVTAILGVGGVKSSSVGSRSAQSPLVDVPAVGDAANGEGEVARLDPLQAVGDHDGALDEGEGQGGQLVGPVGLGRAVGRGRCTESPDS